MSAGGERRGGQVQVELSWSLKDKMKDGEKKTSQENYVVVGSAETF